MKIEKETLQLVPIQLSPSNDGGSLLVIQSRRNYQLGKLQYSYLDVLRNAGTLEGLVQFFLGQGWLVSFRELFNLVQFLVHEKIILNTSLHKYFLALNQQYDFSASKEFKHGISNGELQLEARKKINIKELPFFRSLEPQLANFLLQKTECIRTPANTRLITAGNHDRNLYILLSGQASIYRVIDERRRQLVSVIAPNSIFGEAGFLLNQRRTADVVTSTDCEVLTIHHLPEFDHLIKNDKAQSLQHRFWILQALYASAFFKDLPIDNLDSLIFGGLLCQLPANQVIFRENDQGNTCYILVQGSVIVSQNGKNINAQGQGTCFGEISLLMTGARRTATVTTQQDCLFVEIQQNDFYRILSQNLVLAKEIESLAAQRLANDLRRK